MSSQKSQPPPQSSQSQPQPPLQSTSPSTQTSPKTGEASREVQESVERTLRDQIEVEKSAISEVIDSHIRSIQGLLSPDYDKLTKSNHELNIVAERIKIGEREIAEIKQRHKVEEDRSKAEIKKAQTELGAVKEEYTVRYKKSEEVKEIITQNQHFISNLQAEVKKLQEQIRDRRAYLNEQEDIIAKAIDEGNEQLKAKRREIEEAKLEHEDALRQVILSKHSASVASQEIDATNQKLLDVQAKYDEKAASLRSSLANLNVQVEKAAEQLRITAKETETRLAQAKMAEKEINEKNDLLKRTSIDLDRQRRKLESDQALYSSR
jgi:chromosome segregation ATPase